MPKMSGTDFPEPEHGLAWQYHTESQLLERALPVDQYRKYRGVQRPRTSNQARPGHSYRIF